MPSFERNMRLSRRDITSDVTNLPSTLSSFSSCMNTTWCKVTFIAGCVIGALVLVLVIYCCWRCCCRGRGRRKPATTAASEYSGFPPPGPTPQNFQPMRHENEAPQYAYFEEDDLPIMPTWEGAKKERLMKSEEPVDAEEHELLPYKGNGESSKLPPTDPASGTAFVTKEEDNYLGGSGHGGIIPPPQPLGSNFGDSASLGGGRQDRVQQPNGYSYGQTYGVTNPGRQQPPSTFSGSQGPYDESGAYSQPSQTPVSAGTPWQQQRPGVQQPLPTTSPYQQMSSSRSGPYQQMPTRQPSPYQTQQPLHAPQPIRKANPSQQLAPPVSQTPQSAYIPPPTSHNPFSPSQTPYPDEPQFAAPPSDNRGNQGWPDQHQHQHQSQQQPYHQAQSGGYMPYNNPQNPEHQW